MTLKIVSIVPLCGRCAPYFDGDVPAQVRAWMDIIFQSAVISANARYIKKLDAQPFPTIVTFIRRGEIDKISSFGVPSVDDGVHSLHN